MIKTKTFHPSRIGCPSIPGTMKGIVMGVPGVSEVKVQYEERAIEVIFDDEKTSADEIIKTIGREMGLAMQAGQPGAKKDGGVAESCPM